MIGSIASVRLKEAQVKELLTKKKTEVISGFVAKTGMKFDAPLKLTEEGEIAFDFQRNRNRKRQPCRARNAEKC